MSPSGERGSLPFNRFVQQSYVGIDNLLVFDVFNADRPVFIGCMALEASIRLREFIEEIASE